MNVEEGPSSLPLEDQVETLPVAGGLYVPGHGMNDAFDLWRWSPEQIWQKSAGWVPASEPRSKRRLVPGPRFLRTDDEPKSLGAVVEEYPSAHSYVLTAHGWSGPLGTKSWAEIHYPTVVHQGATNLRSL